MSEEVQKPFDPFELCVAILLGLSAIGAAVSGQQAGQWGGRQLEALAEGNSTTTQASKSYSEAVSLINSDYAVVGRAKEYILESVDAETDWDAQRLHKLASYYLTRQLNEEAYKALGLPMEDYVEEEITADAAPADADLAAEDAEGETAEGEEEDAIESALSDVLDEEDLYAILDVELYDEDAYEEAMFAEGTKLFEDADKKFAEARTANANGDEFDLAGVYFTVALFFAGLGLVFKTKMRWAFLSIGTVLFAGTAVFMAMLPWAT